MGYIEQRIRRANRALRLWGGGLLGVVLLVNLLAYKYWSNVARGPVTMDEAALAPAAIDAAVDAGCHVFAEKPCA